MLPCTNTGGRTLNYNLEFIRTVFTKANHLIDELTELRDGAIFAMGAYAGDRNAATEEPTPMILISTSKDKSSLHSVKENRMQLDIKGVSINSKPRKDGRYQGYYQKDGDKFYIYGKTREEVEKKILQIIKKGKPQRTKKTTIPTLEEWFKRWFTLYKEPNVKANTIEAIKASEKAILPVLGKKSINQIKADDIQKFLLSLKSERKRDICRAYLEQCFKKAHLQGMIKMNPCATIEIKKHVYKHRYALTLDEQNFLVNNIKGTVMEPLINFLLATGLRIGEALALQYGDIDFIKKTVSVNKNVVFIHGKRIVQDSPKTAAGVRTIPCPDFALRFLDKTKPKNTTVFPFSYNAVRLTLYRFGKEHKMSVTAHVLRHTYATRLEEAGIPPKLKQYLLGHSSLIMTQNTYTDIQSAYVERESATIRAVFDINSDTKN